MSDPYAHIRLYHIRLYHTIIYHASICHTIIYHTIIYPTIIHHTRYHIGWCFRSYAVFGAVVTGENVDVFWLNGNMTGVQKFNKKTKMPLNSLFFLCLDPPLRTSRAPPRPPREACVRHSNLERIPVHKRVQYGLLFWLFKLGFKVGSGKTLTVLKWRTFVQVPNVLGFLVPRIIPSRVLGTRTLKYSVLGPSGYADRYPASSTMNPPRSSRGRKLTWRTR